MLYKRNSFAVAAMGFKGLLTPYAITTLQLVCSHHSQIGQVWHQVVTDHGFEFGIDFAFEPNDFRTYPPHLCKKLRLFGVSFQR